MIAIEDVFCLQEVYNLFDMFYVRKMLHQRACQHKTAVAIELMCVHFDSTQYDGVEVHSCIDKLISHCSMSETQLLTNTQLQDILTQRPFSTRVL